MPAISLRLAEPPSVAGTGGGHIGPNEPGAVAVLVAACVELSGTSPGNSKGAWEVAPEPAPAAPPEPVVPAEPFPDPVAGDDSADAPDGDAVDAEDPDGVDDVGIDPTALAPLLVWPFVCSTVWPWAVAMPRNTITMMKTRCIALSCVECNNTALPRVPLDNARSGVK
jgi:hypothetical protein